MKVKKTNSNSLYFVNIFKVVCYYFVLIILLYSSFNISSKNKSLTQNIKSEILWLLNPLIKVTSLPLNAIGLLQKKESLENQKIEIEQSFLNLQMEKANIANLELSNFKQAINFLKLEKFSLIFFSPKYYSSTGLLTDVIFNVKTQELQGVKLNAAVISSGGLYGRVTSINKNNISIISIFNLNSRIPVYTKSSNIYGLASGSGFEIYFTYPNDTFANLIDGEEVWTSGENGLIISEIPFGTLKKIDNKYTIIPFVKTRPLVLGIINDKNDK